MHRNREAQTPVSSSIPIGNAKVPMLAPPESEAGDDALLALERQFEGVAREFAILSERSCELARAEDGIDKPAAERLEQLETTLARLEPIERAIMATPAQTVVGLGWKPATLPTSFLSPELSLFEKADWDRRAMRLLIEAVCIVAGRPLAMGKASKPGFRY